MELSDRKKQILKAVVDDYIATAEPVGSKAVVERMHSHISSATVRNEMADLEELGYLEKPHTSAGRIPSHIGYRLYVDELMNGYKLNQLDLTEVHNALSFRMQELDRLISEAGRMVSELTRHPAIAFSPILEKEAVRRFEVILVDRQTVVLVLVTTADQIKNKICRLNIPLSDFEVAAANRALNTYFTNIPLDRMTDERINAAEYNAGADITEVMIAAIDFAEAVLDRVRTRDAYLEGASQILKYPEYRDTEKARLLLDYLSDRRTLVKLPVPEQGKPLRITIGNENGVEPLEDASIILASYQTGCGASGVIGVVGPTRMDYARVCARLSKFAEGLSRYLCESKNDDNI